MTQPVQEPTQGRVNEGLEFRTRQLFRRPAQGQDTIVFSIKLAGDDPSVDAPAYLVNGRFFVGIPMELDGWYVVKFWGYQSGPDSGGTDTQLRLVKDPLVGAPDTITTTRVLIPDTDIYPSQQAVIDDTVNQVVGEDTMLRVDVYDVGTNVYGLSCEITLSPNNVLL